MYDQDTGSRDDWSPFYMGDSNFEVYTSNKARNDRLKFLIQLFEETNELTESQFEYITFDFTINMAGNQTIPLMIKDQIEDSGYDISEANTDKGYQIVEFQDDNRPCIKPLVDDEDDEIYVVGGSPVPVVNLAQFLEKPAK